jgi:50S ribosomal protein L16 3-hydroxylase
VLAGLSDDDRYGDAGLVAQANPGEITADALARLHAMVLEKLTDRDAFARWFGGYNSTPKYPDIDWAPEAAGSVEELRARLAAGEALHRNPASRFSFVRQGDGVLMFVDGATLECAGDMGAFAATLYAGDRIVISPAQIDSEKTMNLLVRLFDRGAVGFNSAD